MDTRPIVELVYANEYFTLRLRSNLWNDSEDSVKLQALSQASFLVSGAFKFNDKSYIVKDNKILWHERIKAAICEEAIWLLEHDPSKIPEALFNGMSNASVGGVSVTFDMSFICPWICNASKTLIGDLGTFLGDEGSLQTTILSL